jgi:putative ABC transport system permease protein
MLKGKTGRFLSRELRGGDLGILLLAMVLAVTIVTGVGLFTDRLSKAIKRQSSDLLGADLVMEAPRPADLGRFNLPASIIRSEALAFSSMLANHDNFQLTAVRAVDDTYPVRGEVQISRRLFGEPEKVTHGPAPGELWVDARLLQNLQATTGDLLEIGRTQLRVTAVLISQPGGNANVFAPSALMNSADLAASGVIQPGSRVKYLYYFGGNTNDALEAKARLEATALPEQRVYDVKSGQPRVASAIKRAEDYLLLGSALGVILAGAAIAIASRRYALHQEATVAVMKTLGRRASAIGFFYVKQLLLIGMAGISAGLLLGWLLQSLIISLVSATLATELVEAGPAPLVLGAFAGLTCLAGFALPPLWNLRRVPAIRVLRREIGQSGLSLGFASLVGLSCLFLLVYLATGNAVLAAILFIGLGLMVLVVGGLAWLLLHGSHRIGMKAGSQWLLATASLKRRALENSLQVVIFSTTLMLVLVLIGLRTTLIEEWQQRLPAGTPNYFLVNVAPEEVEPVHQWLQQHKVKHQGLYPIVRVRLTRINERIVQQRVSKETDDTASVDRELNLTYTNTVPDDNKIIKGNWWEPHASGLVSVESRLADRLDINLGDTLRFQMGETAFKAVVSNIREVDWERMRPNFYMIFPPAVLADYPATFITSFYMPATQKGEMAELVEHFPTVQVLEVDTIIRQVRTIISQVSMAVEAVLWLIIACGALVLVSTLRNSREERFRESALLRSLGAPGKLVMGALIIEFAVLGLAAGLLAAAGADIIGNMLQKRLFDLPYEPQPLIWLLGPLAGCLLIASLGLFTSRKVTRQSPMLILREYNFS